MSSEIIGPVAALPDLSIVIPAYNEKDRIGETLERVLEYTGARSETAEVILVDNGSSDATVDVARSVAGERLRIVSEPERGKGAAVRAGVSASTGEWVLITDADLSTPIEDLGLLQALTPEADVVIGSRDLPESNVTRAQGLLRETMGKIFNLLLRSLGVTGFRDTQCGFKLIRGTAARDLFPQMTVRGFAYDVELLMLAKRAGLSIEEVGVTWRNSPDSRVKIVRDSTRMLWDTVRLRFRYRG